MSAAEAEEISGVVVVDAPLAGTGLGIGAGGFVHNDLVDELERLLAMRERALHRSSYRCAAEDIVAVLRRRGIVR